MDYSFESIINSEIPVVVDFFATWCGPCKSQSAQLEQLKKMMGDSVKIVKIDIDKNQKLSRKFQIQSVPTLLIYKNRKNVFRKSGLLPSSELQKIINQK